MTKKYFLLIAIIVAISVVVNAAVRRVIPGTDATAGDGSNWTTQAYGGTAGLKAAIAASSANDEVWVKTGTYLTGATRADYFSFVSGVKIYGGFDGTETLLSERNWANNVTILSGDIDNNDTGGIPTNTNSYHVIYNAADLAMAPVLDGFTVSGGYANNGTANDIKGGGIFLNNLTNGAIIENCTIKDNVAVNNNAQGGGIYVSTCSSIAVTNCMIKNNASSGGNTANGGGVWMVNVGCTFNNCKIQNNYSCLDYFATPKTYGTSGFGGGLYINLNASGGGKNATFNNCLISNNFGAKGGGIYVNTGNTPGSAVTITFNNLTAANNWALTNAGGFLATTINSPAALNINNSIFYGNTCSQAATNNGQATIATIAMKNSVIPASFNSVLSVKTACIDSDPLFVDANANDFKLQNTSPCINAGDNTLNITTTDIRAAGYPRKNGTIDMGAYETTGFDNEWVGTSTDWATGSNWSLGTVPGNTELIFVKAATSNPVISTAVTCGSLIIGSGATLTVAKNGKLDVTGSLSNRVGNTGLVIESDATGTSTGSLKHTTAGVAATVSQRLSAARNWYISSPISNANVPVGKTYYKYIEAGTNPNPVAPATAYWAAVGEAVSMTAGVGYIAQPTEASTLTYAGTLNTGNVVVTLTVDGVAFTGYNLVGNPYPSHIAFTDAVATAVNIEPTIWYRTKVDANPYSFITYNAPSGVSVPAGGSDGYIPPMQAFWVKAKAAGTLQFTNAMRVQSADATTVLRAPKINNTKIVRIQISNGTISDEAAIYFNENATDAYDRYDSPKFSNTNPVVEIFSPVETKHLVINGLNEMRYDTEIPIGFMSNSASNLSISATEMSNFEFGTRLILKNNRTLAENELSVGTTINFSTQDATISTDLYSLIFRAPGNSTDIEKAATHNTQVYVNAANQITVKFNQDSENAVVKVYSAIGQLITHKVITQSSTLLNNISEAGVYFVSIFQNGNAITKKVILN